MEVERLYMVENYELDVELLHMVFFRIGGESVTREVHTECVCCTYAGDDG